MRLCWLNKFGDWRQTKTLYSSDFSMKFFFSNGSIFDAKEKNGSNAWRSILKGREVIMRGMRWRIGDGNSVQIYHDKWLPATEHGRVFSPISDSNSEALVSTLIDHETCS